MPHLFEFLIIAGIALALFGPKTLQSLARNAGKTAGEAKNAKDKFMSHVPADDISKLHETLNKVPTNPSQAVQMLMSSGEKKETVSASKPEVKSPESKAAPVKES
ncbi:Sec-independent protein translocase subunit TatA/TatB [Dictyobacter kobayashii]|uniref:Sec-independent protein translocase protein TatA n=1 Tax=Dictyobacter kobayashii TaxID=2014872 RepID=A0A402AMA2_9CHLR|nr:twin-arginine translocase TatA/TatE family subunit [Dictyobacter kobayashii]GCE20202.1 hypothetical protein KDK_40020 [Dictyobacter kobayashii]